MLEKSSSTGATEITKLPSLEGGERVRVKQRGATGGEGQGGGKAG